MSTLDVTRAVLPGMVNTKSGVIINLSSFLCHGGPLLSVYAASKAFVRQFSRDLQTEYQESGNFSLIILTFNQRINVSGVTVMCAAPYYVASKMSKIRHSTWTVPSPDKYAASVLSQVIWIFVLCSQLNVI